MLIPMDEAKLYLKVDNDEEDDFIENLIESAEKIVMDVARLNQEGLLKDEKTTRIAVLYTLAYLFEHREEAEYHELTMMLRNLLFGVRTEVF